MPSASHSSRCFKSSPAEKEPSEPVNSTGPPAASRKLFKTESSSATDSAFFPGPFSLISNMVPLRRWARAYGQLEGLADVGGQVDFSIEGDEAGAIDRGGDGWTGRVLFPHAERRSCIGRKPPHARGPHRPQLPACLLKIGDPRLDGNGVGEQN